MGGSKNVYVGVGEFVSWDLSKMLSRSSEGQNFVPLYHRKTQKETTYST